MHRFPDYLFSGTEAAPPKKEAIHLEVLRLIGENTRLSHGIGRTNLIYQLRNRNRQISDHQLRLLLEELRRQGLITVRPGRCGAQITERGIALLGNS